MRVLGTWSAKHHKFTVHYHVCLCGYLTPCGRKVRHACSKCNAKQTDSIQNYDDAKFAQKQITESKA